VNILLNVYLKYEKKSLFKSRFLAMCGKKNSNICFFLAYEEYIEKNLL